MALATTGVRFDFIGRDVSAGRTADQVDRKFGALGRTAVGVGKAVALGIGTAAVGGVAALGAAMVKGVKDAQAYQTLALKTAAVIKSTGNVARISVGGVQSLASSLESLSGVDEELIINSQNVLATFTKVRNETGKSNDIFTQATKAALNMSTALGTDLQGASIQVGKALNDPIKGVTALQRVGVSFTKQQKDQIKTLVDSGRTLDAQKLILRELNIEFGGAAEAAGKGFAGSVARAKDAAGDFARDLGTRALPKLTEFADWFAVEGVPKMREFAGYVEKTLIPNVVGEFRDLKGKVENALPDIDWSGVGSDLKTDATKWAGELIDGVKIGIDQGDWGPLGASLGTAFGKALSATTGVGASISKAVLKWVGEVDWFKVGSEAGKKSFPFAIGFVSHMTDELVKTAREHPWETALAAVFFLGGARIAGKIAGIFRKIPGGGFLAGFLDAWYKIAKPINDALDWFFRLFRGGFLRRLGEMFPVVGRALDRRVGTLADGIRLRYLYMKDATVRFLKGIPDGIGSMTASILGNIGKLIGRMLRMFAGAGGWLVGRGIQFVGGLLRGIASTSVGRTVGGVIARVTSPFRNAGRWLINAGGHVVVGLLQGIGARMSGVGGWIKRAVVDPIVGAVKRFFGIRSPSTVMAGIGSHLITGLVQGMVSQNPGAIVGKVFGGMPAALGALVGKGLVNLRSLPSKALKALSGLGGKFAGLLDGIGGFLGRGGGSSSGLVAFGRWLQSMGYRVAEHPAFGGVTPGAHVKNSQHYIGQAIDVNTRAGTSSIEQAELARIIGPAHTAGFRTIFMAPGHYGHAHISLYKGGLVSEPVFGVGRSGKTYSFAERGAERVLTAGQTMAYDRMGAGGTVINQVTNVYLDSVALGDRQVVQHVARAVKDARKFGDLHKADFQ
jgi:hypothetical protein